VFLKPVPQQDVYDSLLEKAWKRPRHVVKFNLIGSTHNETL
jgi:hypothetical protein